MGDPSSLNGWIPDHEGEVFSFPTTQLVGSGLSLLPVRPTGLKFGPRLTPGCYHGSSPHVGLYYRPHGGCQSVLRFVP